jgi:hypothetical protein
MVWDKKRNQYVVRSIPQEEIDYYIEENKVVKKPYVAPVYRKYHEGGKGPGYPGHPHPHPYVAVSENTQPHGYTAPVIPGLTDNNPLIGLIDAPREDRLSEFDEVKKADWSTILANPMQAWEYISKNGFTRRNAKGKLEFTRPTQAELDVQKHNVYDGVMSMFNPAAYVEAVKGLDSSLTAADEALLSGIEDGRMSPGDLSKVIGNLSDAGMQALFLTIAPTAGRTLLGAAKELRRPALNTLTQEFRGSRLLGETKGVEPVPSSPLQQLTGEKQLAIKPAPPKVKGKGKVKKYEPSNPYQDSNVAKTITEGGNWSTTNVGVYQYPSFMTGSKLEGQVSAKDGTISRSVLEQLVKNKNTKASEALAVEKILGGFDDKRVPYEYFKEELALGIHPAEIIPTSGLQGYASTGVEALGYKVVGNINNAGALPEGGVTAITNLYKDKSLGLTKEGESHFPDQPHSFWIRSMSTAEEPNVLKALEWQTDVKSLKDPSKGLPGSEEAADYYPERIDERFGKMFSLDQQIKVFKDEIGNTKKNFGPLEQVPIGYTEYLAKIEKGLEIALAARSKGGEVRIAKSKSKGLPLKFVNESLLDAARQGKEYLDVPTAETVFTIEGWTKPNVIESTKQITNQYNILREYDKSLMQIGRGSFGETEDIISEIERTLSINSSVESLINKNVKEKEVIYDRLINSIEKNQPVTMGMFSKLGTGSDFEDMYLDLRRKIEDPTSPPDIKEFWKEQVIKNIKNLKSEVGIRAKQDITKYKEAQKKVDEIKAKGFDLSKISESEMSVTKNYRNFPKLWRSEFGTDVKQVTDQKGNSWMRVKIPENFYQNDISLPLSEIKTYRKGGKALKGLIKKYGGGGSVGGWGAQGNFSTEYNSKQPSVAELPDPNSIPEQNALDALVESGEEPLTEEEKKKQKNQKALQGAMKGASMGMSFGPWGAAIGAVAGGALAYFAKQGAKIRKLYKGGGEVSEGKPDVKDLLHMLKRFGKEPRQPQGSWNMPPDKEGWVPRHDDIFKYLASRDIDTKDDEIAKAYIKPGSVAGAGFADGYDASAYSEKGRYVDPTKPSKFDNVSGLAYPNSKGQRIILASTQLKNPTTRIEEAVHSLQQQRFLDPSVSDSKIGGNKRRLYRMLKKQPWLDELSPDLKKTLTKGNYALKGGGSTSEFEAKLIAAKMTMIHEGVLPEDGNVSDKDLEAIKQWYEDRKNKTGETLWESVLFQDFSDTKYRDEMLSTLNKI